ncbi:MAG: HAD family hydrolase [Nesterenkonia sp.]|nr:HAD family hydrolase [Nesterenkonia sp.]
MAARLMIFDFDGTLCLGDDPVLAYADRVDALLAARGVEGPDVARTAAEAMRSGDLDVPRLRTAGDVAPPQDGYQLVQALGLTAGLSGDECGEAFRAGRRQLLSRGLDATDVHAPADAVGLLDRLARRAAVVLATNAPAEGFAPWLEALGLTEAFHGIVNDAGKPSGMPAALERARALTGVPEDAPVLSIGDIWANDCAPVAARGGTTVLIDHHGTGVGEPTHRVRSLEEAAPHLSAWAAAR